MHKVRLRLFIALSLLLGAMNAHAEPIFQYRFVVESVTCTSDPDGICPSTGGLTHDLGTLLVTLNTAGRVRYELEGSGPSPIPLPFVNEGFLDFEGYGRVTPIFFVEAPTSFNFTGGTFVDAFASNHLEGMMRWFSTDGGLRMSGGDVWTGSIDSDEYFWNHDFTGRWVYVPEPGTLALLSFVLAGLAFIRRRKQ